MNGFEIRIKPKHIMTANEMVYKEAVWNLQNEATKEVTARAYLRVDDEAIITFKNRIRRILMSSGAATFNIVAKKWNVALLGFVNYYREAIVGTTELFDILVKSKTKIQTLRQSLQVAILK